MRTQQKSYKKAKKKDKKSVIEMKLLEIDNTINELRRKLIVNSDLDNNIKKQLLESGFKDLNKYTGKMLNINHPNYIILETYIKQAIEAKILDEKNIELDYWDITREEDDLNNFNPNNLNLSDFNGIKRSRIINSCNKSLFLSFYFLCTCKDLSLKEYNTLIKTIINQRDRDMNFMLIKNDILPLKYREYFVNYFFNFKGSDELFNDLNSDVKKLFINNIHTFGQAVALIEDPTYSEKKLMFNMCIKNCWYNELAKLVNKFGSINGEIDRIVIQYKLGFYG